MPQKSFQRPGAAPRMKWMAKEMHRFGWLRTIVLDSYRKHLVIKNVDAGFRGKNVLSAREHKQLRIRLNADAGCQPMDERVKEHG
jgi:hypothetical protein